MHLTSSLGRTNQLRRDCLFTRKELMQYVPSVFQKGTAYISVKRSKVVDKLNDIIARHYPGALAAR